MGVEKDVTLALLVKYFDVDLSKPSPIEVPRGRFKDVPRLFNLLGFKEGAEIGVHEGSYSNALLRYNPGLHLIGVDLWEGYSEFVDFSANNLTAAYDKARENVKGYNCDLLKGWSSDVVKTIPNDSLDFVFIDANHAYEWVVADIAAWSKKVRPGGIIYGHDFDDYTNRRRWRNMHVVQAVEGWMASYKIEPWFVLTNNRNKCWMYVKD